MAELPHKPISKDVAELLEGILPTVTWEAIAAVVAGTTLTAATVTGAALPIVGILAAAVLGKRLLSKTIGKDSDEAKVLNLLQLLHTEQAITSKQISEAFERQELSSIEQEIGTGLNHKELVERLTAVSTLISQEDKSLEAIQATLEQHQGFWFSLDRVIELNHQELVDKLDGMKSVLEDIRSRLNPSPPLSLPPKEENVNGDGRLWYKFQRIDFFGRENELAEIQKFADSNEPFIWWAGLGRGGWGKSRLAMEFCNRLDNRWDAGFLTDIESFDFVNWQPQQDTFIVVDYLSKNAKALANIIRHLNDRRTNLNNHHIRILVIDRSTDAPGWRELTNSGNPCVEQRHYRKQLVAESQLSLQDSDENIAWEIATQIGHLKNSRLPDRISFIQDLRGIDPLLRPLFASIAAEVVTEGNTLANKTKEELLAAYLAYCKRHHWLVNGAEVDPKHLNLIALSTLVRGIKAFPPDESLLKEPSIKEFLPTEIKNDQIAAITGRDIQEEIPILEPDILGEYFVLVQLRPANAFSTDPIDNIVMASWKYLPWGIATFCNLACEEYLDHPRLAKIISTPTIESAKSIWAEFAVTLTAMYGKNNRHDDLHRICETIQLIQNASSFAKSMSLLNRAISSGELHSQEAQKSRAKDYTTIMNMPNVPNEVLMHTLIQRSRVYCSSMQPDHLQIAISDCTQLLNMQDVPPDLTQEALINRRTAYGLRAKDDDIILAIDDCTMLMTLPLDSKLKAEALISRSIFYGETGGKSNFQRAIVDCTSVIEMPGVINYFYLRAILYRGMYHNQMESQDCYELATKDLLTVVNLPYASPQEKSLAWFNLAITYSRQNNTAGAIESLRQWQGIGERTIRKQIDKQNGFDNIRNEPEFIQFLENLPEGE